MDPHLLNLIVQSTERLFKGMQASDLQDERLRTCVRILGLIWRQVAALSGPRAAEALFNQALLEAGRLWPLIGTVKVSSRGIDASALEEACKPADYGLAIEACKTVVGNCLTLLITLAGEGTVLAIVDRVEAEMQGPEAKPGSVQQSESRDSDQESAAAA